MHKLFRIYHYLRMCAPSQVTSLCILNFLSLVVPMNLWPQHVDLRVVPYIVDTQDPGQTPTYIPNTTPTENQQAKDR